MHQPTEGEILFNGRSILQRKLSSSHCPWCCAHFSQNIRLFPSLTVFDNVRVAFHLHITSGIVHALSRGPVFRREEQEICRARCGRCPELFNLRRYCRTNRPNACPTAINAAWKSSAPSPRARGSSCSTNLPPA